MYDFLRISCIPVNLNNDIFTKFCSKEWFMLPERYNRESISRVLENPSLLTKEIRRLLSRIIYPVNNLYFMKWYKQGIDVMAEDWDNLIILDACRYDYFEQRNDLDGDLRPVLSRGSHSFEFMQKNFVGEHLHDTVYVTANPHAPKLAADIFYDLEIILDQYMNPGKVVEKAIEMHNRHPNKRLIVHLMPPHRPHLGPTAEQLRAEFDLKDWETVDKQEESDSSGRPIWNLAIHNEVSVEQIRKSYRETLDIALDYAEQLNQSLDGKTVITSDHGELLGERATPLTHRRYGHPHEVYCHTLRTVPWLEIDSQDRRDITSEEPLKKETIDDNVIDDRLKALGYKPQ